MTGANKFQSGIMVQCAVASPEGFQTARPDMVVRPPLLQAVSATMIAYYALRLGGAVIGALPLGVSYAIADILGDLWFILWRPGRARTVDNMCVVLGKDTVDREVVATAARSVRNYARYIVDFVRFPRLNRDQILDAVHFDGWDRLDAAVNQDRGVIFASAHLGNWDMAGAAIASRGYALNAIGETFANRRLDAYVIDSRRRIGVTVWPMEGALKRIITILRSCQILAILVDRPESSGVPVRFFDEEARVPAGAASLALKTGATIIVGAVVPQRIGHYQGFMEVPIKFESTGNAKADAQALTQQIMTAIERLIRSHPEHWYMFRSMWPGTRRVHPRPPQDTSPAQS